MTVAFYYSLIFFISIFLYLEAVNAKIAGKPIIQYICYFFLFLIALFLI